MSEGINAVPCISMIFAMEENGGIGLDNKLPWRLPSDLKYFKEVTENQVVIMGRKTFESLGTPLPNRKNIVLTRDTTWEKEGVHVFHDVESILEYLKGSNNHGCEVFVIGGREVYSLLYDKATFLYITHIHEHFEADTHIDFIDWDEWQMLSEVKGQIDDKNTHAHEFVIYERK